MENTGFLNPWDSVVELPADTQNFLANGIRYFINRNPKSLSLDRYIEFERKSIELGFTGDFAFIVRKISFAMRNCNPTDFNTAYVTLYNLLQGMTDDETKLPIALVFCTLFIIREGSDYKHYDAIEAKSDILNWRTEGLAVGFFLDFTTNTLLGYNEIYQAISQLFSEIPANQLMNRERQASLMNSLESTEQSPQT